MYAIIESGSSQYQVEEGDIIEIDLLPDTNNASIEFKKILLISDQNGARVGTPYLDNYSVMGELLEEVKGPKVIAFKYKKRKNYRRTVGHRQKYAKVKITKIQAKG